MKIAYLILAYKLPQQLIRLVNRLNGPETYFFIHIDKKSPPEYFKIVKDKLSQLPNVMFIKQIKSDWGKISCVNAVLMGFESIIDSSIDFDYVVHLSGQDYPIRPQSEFTEFLNNNAPYSFVEYRKVPVPDYPSINENILLRHYFFGKYHLVFPKSDMFSSPCINHFWNPVVNHIAWRPQLPFNYIPYYGPAQFCLHKSHVQYISEFVKLHPGFVNFFVHVNHPDEYFFQTLLINSPLRRTVQNLHLGFVKFYKKNPHPKLLAIEDFQKIQGSKMYFARKFDMGVDSSILDKIDEVLLSGSDYQFSLEL